MDIRSQLREITTNIDLELQHLAHARRDMAKIRARLQEALQIDMNVFPHPTVEAMIEMLIEQKDAAYQQGREEGVYEEMMRNDAMNA